MNNTVKLLIVLGVLVCIAAASYFLFGNQSKNVEIVSPQKAEMIRNMRQQMSTPHQGGAAQQPPQPTTPQQ